MMILSIYFLILFSKRKTLQSNHLQFELKAVVLNFSFFLVLTSINDNISKIRFTNLNYFSVCVECTITMNLVCEYEFVTMTSVHHLVSIFVFFSNRLTYLHLS